jgi:hypothetical protein
MKSKPLAIVVLAALYFLAPLVNIWFSSYLEHLSVLEYLREAWARHEYLGLLFLFGLWPLAGLAIYAVKGWSYPVYLVIAGITVYSNTVTWLQFPGQFSLTLMLCAHAVNIGIVGYFLLPAVRAPYFDPRLRWWEQKPRYCVKIDAILKAGSATELKGQISNLSEGGVLVRSEAKLEAEAPVRIAFAHLGFKMDLSGKVVHFRQDQEWVVGIQFNTKAMTHEESKDVRRLVRTLDQLGTPTVREKPNVWRDFKAWLATRRTSHTAPTR